MIFLLLHGMFGDVYKIREDAIPLLLRKMRRAKILYIGIALLMVMPAFIYSTAPLFSDMGTEMIIPIVIILAVWFYIIIKLRKTQQKAADPLRAFEFIIAEQSLHCKYSIGTSIQNMTIPIKDISRISHYVHGKILVVGVDLAQSFSIPSHIEKREEIIERLSAIKPIGTGKKEILLYYMQRINMIVFGIAALLILLSEVNAILIVASISMLYSIFLPVYFFIVTKNIPQHIKIINGLYVIIGLIVFIAGLSKILHN